MAIKSNLRFNRELLQKCKDEKNISQKIIAESIGISTATLSQIMTSKCLPRMIILYRIAKYFDKSMEDFLIEDNGG